jgi:hypothetical protein
MQVSVYLDIRVADMRSIQFLELIIESCLLGNSDNLLVAAFELDWSW